MASSPFEPIKINLVEEKDWEKRFGFDSVNYSDSAWEDYRHMSAGDFESLIDDLWSAKDTKKRVSKKRLTSEELEFLAEQLKEGNEHLEPIKQTITDAMTWMYEAAAQPTDGDIEEAMETASELVLIDESVGLWDSMLVDEEFPRGPKEWSPRKKYRTKEIEKQLVGQVSYERKKNNYERYLIFNFWDARVVQDLFSRMKGSPEIYNHMKSEFNWLSKNYIHNFFTALGDNMDDIDISNRTDWNASWKSMLQSGVEPDVREGIREVLKEMPDA